MAAVKPHKVPESVFEVEFKLFDFMTMKQFVIIMITAVFATMFYFLLDKLASGFLKWLVVSTIVMIGLIIAFVKVGGEPFEVYVSNFILALVSPQRRVWRKESEIPRYLRENPQEKAQKTLEAQRVAQKELEKTEPPVSEEQIAREIQREKEPTKFDVIEQQYLKGEVPQFGAVYEAGKPAPSTTAPSAEPKMQAQARHAETKPGRDFIIEEKEPLSDASQPPGIVWGIVKDANDNPLPGAKVLIQDESKATAASIQTDQNGQFRTGGVLNPGIYTLIVTHPSASFAQQEISVGKKPLEPVIITPTSKPQAKPQPTPQPASTAAPQAAEAKSKTPQRPAAQPPSTTLATEAKSKTPQRPATQPAAEDRPSQQLSTPQPPTSQSPSTTQAAQAQKLQPTPRPEEEAVDTTKIAGQMADQHSAQSAGTQTQPRREPQPTPVENLPDAQSLVAGADGQPNLLRGEVVDTNGNPLQQATITVKDKSGSVARSMTTNPLGQFFSSSPLQNGEYMIELEGEGYTFGSYTLKCTGQVLRPKRFTGKLSNVY